ncbi:MAG: hypothetical protein RBT71_00170 [Flavobacteriales bacterium]|jgi:hypothetical protein|nr:hypothetical protein [Flavobacteriales bacterium]
MKNLLPVLAALLLTACHKAPPTGDATLRITLVPEWDGAPFQSHTEYSNFMGYRTSVELLTMYFSDATLSGDGSPVMAKDVELFRLTDGPATAHWPVQSGTWTTLEAGLGVPDALNFADPANYPAGHPLSVNQGTYWTWATGYRFVMFEGRYDTDPAGTGPLITTYAIHPGTASNYMPFAIELPGGLHIAPGDTADVVLHVAVDRFFVSDTDTIDLATENTAHGNNHPLQMKLMRNVVKSFTVQ